MINDQEFERRPCPFCGHVAMVQSTVRTPFQPDKIVLDCTHCKASGPEGANSLEAIVFWNRRADPWIPVGERLPDKGRNVLVCYGDTVSEGYIGRYDRWYDGPGRPIPVPTHWMPLPAAPKGGDA